MYLRDAQVELSYLVARWLLDDASGPGVADDVGGILLLQSGSPTLGVQGLCRGDRLTCALGGYTAQANYFSAPVTAFILSSGASIEAVTALDPNGQTFSLLSVPGQAQLVVANQDLQWTVWIGATAHLLAASSVLVGYPQHVVGAYDPVAQVQAIYVDGALAASQTLSGAVGTPATGATAILEPSGTSACAALGQDVALYDGALSASRVAHHFRAFAQVWAEPGRVPTFPRIGVRQ
jgi:hypothetical protein